MWRNLFTVFLAYAVLLFSIEPAAYGQYPAPSYGQSYPGQQYPSQPYPQNQPYGQNPYPQMGPQDPNVAQNSGTDAQHGVARLSVVQGDVNVRRGDNGELVAAVTNAPIMAQDHLQTSLGSRAEVELDYGNFVRLGPITDVGFADLEYHRYQVQLAAGAIIYRVLQNSNAQAEVDTPSIALRPEGQGEYRIAVLNDGTTQISVRSGQAEIFSPRGSEQIAAGRTVLVRGNPSDPEFQPASEGPRDQLDDWSANRDRELMASQSYQYVSPDITGAQDLDAYGSWVPSQYGQVWEPTGTPTDWSPYSDGQWSWQPYYGWTWVDAAPWGWAPYHYGRWFWNGGYHWCWWPGSIGPRYLWNPALVGFFGVGTGVGLAFSALGWVALAPFELFHAWWGFGFGHGFGFGGYGFVRGANLVGMYRNAAIRGGAMMAAYSSFGGLRQRFSPATGAQLRGATLFHGQVPVSPSRTSYQFSARSAVANPRLASAANRQFFSTRGTGFTQRTAADGFARAGATQSSYGRTNNYAPAARSQSSSGWQRFGDPGRSTGMSQGFAAGQQDSGWHHFGEARQATPAYNYGRSYGPSGNYSSPRYSAPQQRQSFSGYGGASNGFAGGRSTYSPPHYSAPQAQHYSAPHYSAPSSHGGGESHSGGGGGGSHGGGGGGHSSSGGHRGR